MTANSPEAYTLLNLKIKNATTMKPQLKTLTWEDFDKPRIRQEMYGDFSGTILDILNHPKIPNWDKLWAFTHEGIMDDKTLQLFTVRCSQQAQHIIENHRSINILDITRRYGSEPATDEELTKACDAAHEAACIASWTAWEAALEAEEATWEDAGKAEEAVKKAQVQIAIELIKEFYEV